MEDHCADALLLDEWLELAGLKGEVVHVVTFADASLRWPEGDFDALLLVLDIPDGFGLDLLERGLALAGDVPLVVLSGRADEAVAAGAPALGARAYVAKGPASVHGLWRLWRGRHHRDWQELRSASAPDCRVPGADRRTPPLRVTLDQEIADLLSLTRAAELRASSTSVPCSKP